MNIKHLLKTNVNELIVLLASLTNDIIKRLDLIASTANDTTNVLNFADSNNLNAEEKLLTSDIELLYGEAMLIEQIIAYDLKVTPTTLLKRTSLIEECVTEINALLVRIDEYKKTASDVQQSHGNKLMRRNFTALYDDCQSPATNQVNSLCKSFNCQSNTDYSFFENNLFWVPGISSRLDSL